MKDFIGVNSKLKFEIRVLLAFTLESMHGHTWLGWTDLESVDQGGLFKARLSDRLGLPLHLLLWLNMLV